MKIGRGKMKKTGSEIAKILTNRFVRSLRVNIIPSDCTELYENLSRKHNVIFIITHKNEDEVFPRIEIEYNKGYVRGYVNKGDDEYDFISEDSEHLGVDYELLRFGKELYKNLVEM